MIEAGLIASRFVHYVAVLTLFGAALFPLYARGVRLSFDTAHNTGTVRLRLVLLFAALLAFLSGIGWFLFTSAAMVGDVAGASDPSVLRAVIEATDFGPLWIARLALALLLCVLLIRWPGRLSCWLVPLLALFLLASLAGTGHAHATEGMQGKLHLGADALHLLAAGVWLGGLWPLGLALAAAQSEGHPNRAVGDMLMRFSRVGSLAVAVLVASGLVNSWFLVGSLQALIWTPYGQLLLLKLALFSFMALLAAVNRFWITPKFAATASTALWRRRIRRHVLAEQALGMIVLAVVSLLGTLEPALQG